jgi:MYXO-CTERM domain-containing protein
MLWPLGGLLTAHIAAGSLSILDFAPAGPATVGPGGLTTVNTDVYADAVVVLTNYSTEIVWQGGNWAGALLPFDVGFTTSVSASDVVTGTLAGTALWRTDVSGTTFTFEVILDVEGTAHVVPDPSLGGLIMMALGGAGAWLRRRRNANRSPNGLTAVRAL